MANYKVITNHSLKEYNKRYRFHKNLIRLSKLEVEDFDKQSHSVGGRSLLNHNKWWLIDGVYYQVPKTLGRYWFRNLNAGVQTLTCLLGAGIIATAVTVPLFLLRQSVSNIPVELAEGISGVSIDSQKTLSDGSLEITLKPNEGKEISTIEKITIGNEELKVNEDYTLENNKITIKKEVLEKHKDEKIIIKPKVINKFDPSKEFECDSEFCNVSFEKKLGPDYVYEISIKNDYVDTKEFSDTLIEYVKVGDYTLVTTPTPEYVVAKSEDKLLLTIRGDVFNTHKDTIKIKPSIKDKSGDISLNKEESYLSPNSIEKLVATVSIAGTTVSWNSSDDNVATVNQRGEVTGVAVGDCKIFASAFGKTVECAIHVVKPFSVDWTGDHTFSDGTEISCYNFAYNSGDSVKKIIIGKLEDYGKTVKDLPWAYVGEEGEDAEKVIAYIDASEENRSLYLLSNGKIKFSDNDLIKSGRFKYGYFYGLENLEEFDAPNIDTTEATDFNQLFYECKKMKHANLSNFDTSNVTNFQKMFFNCHQIEVLDLSSFTVCPDLAKCRSMFEGCHLLRKIYVNENFDLSFLAEESAFNTCTSLVGEKGSLYANILSLESHGLHIDGLNDEPGLFSRKDALPEYLSYEDGTNDDEILIKINQEANEIPSVIDISSVYVIDGEIKKVIGIADNGFSNQSTIQKVRLPYNITYIGKEAFKGCSSLNNVYYTDDTNSSFDLIPDEGKSIRYSTFEVKGQDLAAELIKQSNYKWVKDSYEVRLVFITEEEYRNLYCFKLEANKQYTVVISIKDFAAGYKYLQLSDIGYGYTPAKLNFSDYINSDGIIATINDKEITTTIDETDQILRFGEEFTTGTMVIKFTTKASNELTYFSMGQ